MKIPAIRVEINGKLIAIAGKENISFLSGHIGIGVGSMAKIDVHNIAFGVIGVETTGSQSRQLTWSDGIKIAPGDKVTFEVIETENPTPPTNAIRTPSTEELAGIANSKKPASE